MKTFSELNEKELDVFKQFREKIKDCILVDGSDDYVLKWLVARDFNVMQADKMLRLSLEWRKANRIDDIVHQWEPPVALKKYYPMGICGRDKFGCPVWVNAFGRTDWRGILQSTTKKDFLRYVCYLAETSMHEMKKAAASTGNPVTYQTFVIDMDQLSLRQMALKPVREVGVEAIKMSEMNYPESLRRVFIINAPAAFNMVFSMVKPFLHQPTLDKVRVFGYDKQEWTKALLDEIDANQLPAFYGGNLTDPDGNPKCQSKFNMGGEVPDSFFLQPTKPQPKSYMSLLTIPSGSSQMFELSIQQVNSILKWEFMTEESDLMFKIYYYDQSGGKVDLIPAERVDCHLMMEEGEIVCPRPSTYVVVFDNTYSYLKSKKVWYCISIDLPNADSAVRH